MLQQIDSNHLAALESELARVTAQRDALRDALQTATDDYADLLSLYGQPHRWGQVAIEHHRSVLQSCQD